MRTTIKLVLVVTAAVLVIGALAAPASAQSYSANTRYPNPDGDLTSKRGKPCADPWVTTALEIVLGPRFAEGNCLVSLYNGGRWNSFDQLVHAVARSQSSLSSRGYRISTGMIDGRAVAVLMQGQYMVAAGAGNLIGQDGATVVGQNGAGLITDGGSTLRNLPKFEVLAQGANIAAGLKTVPLSGSTIVIR